MMAGMGSSQSNGGVEPSPPDGGRPGDVRMRGFRSRSTVDEALGWIDQVARPLESERVDLSEAGGRVLAADVTSPVDVPGFRRAMMDGFAVQASATMGASPYARLALTVVGQAMPGRPFEGQVGADQAVRIMTGAPMPPGADAVIPAEQAEETSRVVQITGQVPPGKHVGLPGEDIRRETVVLRAARRLRPQDVGLLASIGVARPKVVRRPRVRVVVTGNELLPAGSMPRGVSIPDSNGPMLAALIARDGGLAHHPGVVPDQPAAILDALRDRADVVVVSGGSSVGIEDHVPRLLAEHGELAIHGIAMRPSSPTGMGRLDGRLVFLLPGNPVSCFCAYEFFAGRALRRLGGRDPAWPYRSVTVPLRRKLVSVVGRTDYARVRIDAGRAVPVAIGGAAVLSSTTEADGFVVVPPDCEGFPEASQVEVFLYG